MPAKPTLAVCTKCGGKKFFYKPELSTWEKCHRVYKCEGCGGLLQVQEKEKYDKAIYVYLEEGDEIIT